MKRMLAAVVLLAASLGAWAQEKVVYHFDSGLSQAVKGLRNMRNHLDTDPTAKLIAVTHAKASISSWKAPRRRTARNSSPSCRRSRTAA